MCGFQVEVERMRGQAQDRLMNKVAAARHKAEEKRAAAEAKRNRQAAKTERQVEYIFQILNDYIKNGNVS
jgi:hypothetical protein